MITWNLPVIQRHMQKRKLANANQLCEFTGLTVPTAYNVLKGAPLQRIEVATLETLARKFDVKPFTLLEWSDG